MLKSGLRIRDFVGPGDEVTIVRFYYNYYYCYYVLGKGLIEKIEVLKDIGQVLLEFKSSPNVCLLHTFLDE